MKSIIAGLLVAMVLNPIFSPGQKTRDFAEALSQPPQIQTTTTSTTFGSLNRPALEAEVTGPEKEFTKHFEKYFKTSHGIKFRRNSGYNEAAGISVGAWSADSLTMMWSTDSRHERVMVRVSLATYRSGQTGAADEAALEKFRPVFEDEIRSFYTAYYQSLINELKREADLEKRDLAKAEKDISRNEKLILSTQRGIESDRSSADRAESSMKNAENQKKTYESQLEHLEKSKESLTEELNSVTDEVSAKQREYDAYNRSGDLNTKQAERIAKDLDKLKSKQEKARDKVADANDEIRDQKELILKTSEKYTEAESARRKADNALSDKEHKLKNAEHDLDKAKKKREDEQREFNEASSVLEDVKKAFDRFNSGQ